MDKGCWSKAAATPWPRAHGQPREVKDLRAFLEETLAAPVEAARHVDALEIDGALTAGAANIELMETIGRAGPFGAGIRAGVRAAVALGSVRRSAGDAHVRLRLKAGDNRQIGAIAFRALGRPLGDALLAGRGRTMHVAGCLTLNSWQGTERVEMRVLDAAPAEPLAAR